MYNEDIFTKRGIADAVRTERGYVPWESRPIEGRKGKYDEDLSAIDAAYGDLDRADLSFMRRIAREAEGGYVMTRYSPFPWLAKVYAEVRPAKAVHTRTSPQRHWHGVGSAPEGAHRVLTGHAKREHLRNDVYLDDHGDFSDDGVHAHWDIAKYVFPPSPKKTIIDRFGRTRRVKDGSKSRARRIDVHPRALPLLDKAKTVFFGFEGILKNDAILTAILGGGLDASVFNVPSVSLWDAPELANFVERYLRAKTVVIVPDADWYTKDPVINQARVCAAALRRLGAGGVYIAAPPVDRETGKDIGGKGIDDFLGPRRFDPEAGSLDGWVGGGKLDELKVIDRLPAFGETDAPRFAKRPDGSKRNADVLRALGLWAGQDGRFTLSARMVAATLGVHHSTVDIAVRELVHAGCLDVESYGWDGDVPRNPLAVRKAYFSRQVEWEQMPALVVPKDFRAIDRGWVDLCDVPEIEL